MSRIGWKVVITKTGKEWNYNTGYFPRFFAYKKDAETALNIVLKKGGEGHLVRESLSKFLREKETV